MGTSNCDVGYPSTPPLREIFFMGEILTMYITLRPMSAFLEQVKPAQAIFSSGINVAYTKYFNRQKNKTPQSKLINVAAAKFLQQLRLQRSESQQRSMLDCCEDVKRNTTI